MFPISFVVISLQEAVLLSYGRSEGPLSYGHDFGMLLRKTLRPRAGCFQRTEKCSFAGASQTFNEIFTALPVLVADNRYAICANGFIRLPLPALYQRKRIVTKYGESDCSRRLWVHLAGDGIGLTSL